MSHTRVLDTSAELADLKRRVADLEAQIRLLVSVRPSSIGDSELERVARRAAGPLGWPVVSMPPAPAPIQPGETAWLGDRPPSQIVGHWLPATGAAPIGGLG